MILAALVLAAFVSAGLIGALIFALWLNARIEQYQARLTALAGSYRDAGVLVETRWRFRQRQQRVEHAVASGTVGLETVHRSIAHRFGAESDAGAGIYEQIRHINRGVGSAVSGLFAPRTKPRSERLADWRARRETNEDEGEDHDP